MFKPSKLTAFSEKMHCDITYRTARVNYFKTVKGQNVEEIQESQNQFAWIVKYIKPTTKDENNRDQEE